MSKTIAILGATGSVGMQAFDVARDCGYRVDFFSANKNCALAEKLAREFSPSYIAMADNDAAKTLSERLKGTDIKVLFGNEGILEGISLSESETVVNSILGKAGLMPTLSVISAGKRLALANKESLVVAGDIVMERARFAGVEILPVDSEHSAIFQSKKSGKDSEIKNLILTASGGPFYGKSKEELRSVTLEQTLAHPTWNMGKKITVDSATLMNKGFEVIEAAKLFGVGADRIKVLVHRESIIHSAVEYIDNSVIAELSVPDMRMCVKYAVDYPERTVSKTEELDLAKIGSLSFGKVDEEAFPLLPLAKTALSDGGAMCAVVNAADEVAAAAFLDGKIAFWQISELVEKTYKSLADCKACLSLEDILEADRAARIITEENIRILG